MKDMLRLLCSGFCIAGLFGCTSEVDSHKELRAYMDEVYQQPIKELDPIIYSTEMESFTYQVSNKKNPFLGTNKMNVIGHKASSLTTEEGIKSIHSPLKSSYINSIKMIGSLKSDNKAYALIESTEGTMHKVEVGDYLRSHDGRIHEITFSQVRVIEKIKEKNGWSEQLYTLDLQKK